MVRQSCLGAKVSWTNICCLKSEDGLGIKNMKSWNKVCMIRLIKRILAGEGSLWAAWLKSYVFKDKSLWYVEIDYNTSWCLKRLLKLRPEMQQLLTSRAATTSTIWDSTREKRPTVPWQKLLWFPLLIPKHNLITWMTFLDKLPTKLQLERQILAFLGYEAGNECTGLLAMGGKNKRLFQSRARIIGVQLQQRQRRKELPRCEEEAVGGIRGRDPRLDEELCQGVAGDIQQRPSGIYDERVIGYSQFPGGSGEGIASGHQVSMRGTLLAGGGAQEAELFKEEIEDQKQRETNGGGQAKATTEFGGVGGFRS
ncbi:hypothetical protein F3Y22_tig00111693pilonHSYRG00064 [Hibiscus syriacus]|uniref:Reverse transcriptase zinc-binding domain-containing protein n=1 Tax=Hibiscus syriacus TaxID=106335 RepID=A0A6A2YBG4_HIBSY|nr:hypothetical protein F3Y22_tig00111693pilonHSYRG00064 [Hibiscus syriacus]